MSDRSLLRNAATRRVVACVLACAAVLAVVAGCADSPPRGPLAADVAQKSSATCVPAPNPGSAITSWHSTIWFALDMFVNQSRSELTIESVSLIDPHNVTLRGALVYEMAHSQHPLLQTGGLADLGKSVPTADWARRQPVPGAVIAAGHKGMKLLPSASLNIYEIVPAVEQKAPGGGWALGEVVSYRASGQTYTVRAYTGYAIGVPAANSKDSCSAQLKAINAAFKTSG
jgi:hypothetical protein